MKLEKVTENVIDGAMIVFMIAAVVFPCWAIYKFFDAIFFLLNKLIDKI